MKTKYLITTSVCLAALLSGCAGEQSELKGWMAQQRKEVNPIITKVDKPKEFAPFVYENVGQLDPFASGKLNKALEQAQKVSRSGLRPDLERRREALEEHPLDAIKMVGHIRRQGTNTALLAVSASVFPIKVGSYLGQNFGKVIKISETEVLLKELVQDATGDWVQRDATITLQDATPRKN
jgi:type IV pilus assembly protein PilP